MKTSVHYLGTYFIASAHSSGTVVKIAAHSSGTHAVFISTLVLCCHVDVALAVSL
jgi:hypothetical protein